MSVRRVAMISYHTCPLALQEGKEMGGMNVYVLELSRQLSRMGIAVDVFTRSQDYDQPHIVQVDTLFRVIHVAAGPEHPVPKKQLGQFLPDFVAGIHAFMAQHTLTYDVVHCHYYLSGLAGLEMRRGALAARPNERPTPLLMSFHTLALMKNLVARDELEREEGDRLDAESLLVREVDAIIAPSISDRDYLRYLLQADARRIVVIPPGVDVQNFHPIDQAHARARLNVPPERRMILFCGRIEPLKGIDLLLYALRIMVEQHPDPCVCLWIIGGDISQPTDRWSKELQKLEKLRHRLQLTSLVHFAGQQAQEMLPYYYNAADLVVMPSHYESFGMAAAEAMACGTPIITTNATGISSLIDERHDLVITSVNNPLLLASQMARLLHDAPARQQIGQQMRETVADLDWATIARRVLAVYEHTLTDDSPLPQD